MIVEASGGRWVPVEKIKLDLLSQWNPFGLLWIQDKEKKNVLQSLQTGILERGHILIISWLTYSRSVCFPDFLYSSQRCRCCQHRAANFLQFGNHYHVLTTPLVRKKYECEFYK